MRLADIGLLETDLERAAQIATEKPYWNPRDITKDAILNILKQAWAGHPPELT
jgi:maleylacetate reductase